MTDVLRPIYSPGEIAGAVARIAGEIRRDCHDRTPLLVCVLNASFIFTADLVRAIDIPLEVDFMGVTSYGAGTTSSGSPRITRDIETRIAGRHVILVESMIETGKTVATVKDHLTRSDPSALKVCVLLVKETGSTREVAVDYAGFTVGKEFVVGYGMDYGGRYRHLPGIYALETGGE